MLNVNRVLTITITVKIMFVTGKYNVANFMGINTPDWGSGHAEDVVKFGFEFELQFLHLYKILILK